VRRRALLLGIVVALYFLPSAACGAQPILSVQPTSVSLETPQGSGPLSRTVQIRNAGNGALKWFVELPTPTWLTVTPTRGVNSGTLTLTVATSTLPVGEHFISFRVVAAQQPATPVNVRVVVTAAPQPPSPACSDTLDNDEDGSVDMDDPGCAGLSDTDETDPPPPPPPPTSARGPQPTITCPDGALPITPGTDVQAVVNANPAGTSFCFVTGTHVWTRTVTPKTGNTFTGEPGAILDWSGTSPRTSDTIEGFFVAHNQDIDDVTFRNLTLKGSPARGINGSPTYNCDNTARTCAYGTTGADRWTIDHVLIDGCQYYGVVLSNYVTLTNSIIRHCGETQTGGAYVGSGGGIDHGLIENNDFSHYGNETKIYLSRHVTIRGNWYHDTTANGPWMDGENIEALIEHNLVTDVAQQGIFYEISGNGIIRNNTLKRIGDNAIYISTSHDVQVYGNYIEDSFRAIQAMVNGPAVGSHSCGWIHTHCALENVSVRDNTIVVSSRSGARISGLGSFMMDAATLATYTDGSHNITFTNNHYMLPDLALWGWFWGDASTDWAGWQALGHDLTGTVEPQ
jgi:hypothetical protein